MTILAVSAVSGAKDMDVDTPCNTRHSKYTRNQKNLPYTIAGRQMTVIKAHGTLEVYANLRFTGSHRRDLQ